jgi:prepilin-type N-terminal cleavage/methylation domain-containing protein
MSRRRARRGFTLVEMLVAVVLLGVGISACVACMGTSTRASALAEEYTAVQLLAREKLSEIELSGTGEGEDQGDFGEERPGYAWKTVAEPGGAAGVRRVRLYVLWGDEANPRTAEFVTYVRSAGAAG